MDDKETVIKGLECLAQKQEQMANPCSKCDYHDRPNFAFCVVDVATDALALLKEQQQQIWELLDQVEYLTDKLKEQEAVEPILDSFLHKRCPLCRTLLKGKFCHECGQAVKWE